MTASSKSKKIHVGEKVGKLTVREIVTEAPYGLREWLCSCDCGNFCVKTEEKLWAGRKKATYSCGCSVKEARQAKVLESRTKVIGRKFGRLVPFKVADPATIHPDYRDRTFWLCHCDCGRICRVAQYALVTGGTLSCGCGLKGSHGKNKKKSEIRSKKSLTKHT